MKQYYITTAIPYVNGKPHIGHALEFLHGDALARYHALCKKDVLFLTGSDENALKNVQAAEDVGKDVRDFVHTNADSFEKLIRSLNIRVDIFQRGSDTKNHFPSSQKLWKLCEKAGDIYQKEYSGLYCVGCEVFYEKNELDDHGECREHPGKKLETVTEKNYFFKLSRYQKKLIDLISHDTLKIVPESRKNEMMSFLKEPLHDISISRSNTRAKNWGVPVPGDDSQRMYVWFDALNIYQSGIGFGTDNDKYKKWWPADVHVIGKGINRFHTIYWPAFLMSAGLQLPKEVFVHGYITVEGQKMSKSIGNVIDPFELIKTYGIDPVRYYLLREIPSHGDGDFSERRFKELYNADLANGLGNTTARIAALAQKASITMEDTRMSLDSAEYHEYTTYMDDYRMSDALAFIWARISELDKYINTHEPWKQEGDDQIQTLKYACGRIADIAYLLQPFLPHTAEKIASQFTGAISSSQPLFPRLQ